jgi:hypothetical protein
MSDGLERLLDTLLYEGYALYPYTPGATKNATPTPFGIVYPRAYAAGLPSTFDHLRLECEAVPGAGAELHAEVRFLTPVGERHQARARRLALPPVPFGEEAVREFSVDGLSLRMRVRSGDGRARMCVHNLTDAPAGLDRGGALRRSLISTHPVLRISDGRFVSALESDARSVNTWAVLASPEDDVMVGAAIILPDHPQLAPESLGSLFDSTEIEEALLLHVHALSDEERAEIERQDPAVSDMVARAATTTPEQILALHGRLTMRDPSAGEHEAEAPDGRRFRRGTKVVLRPGPDADLHARLLEGREATVERIFVDYDGKVHLGVTVDGDPGQDLLRETNRFLFFFPPEVEVIS